MEIAIEETKKPPSGGFLFREIVIHLVPAAVAVIISYTYGVKILCGVYIDREFYFFSLELAEGFGFAVSAAERQIVDGIAVVFLTGIAVDRYRLDVLCEVIGYDCVISLAVELNGRHWLALHKAEGIIILKDVVPCDVVSVYAELLIEISENDLI